MSLAWTEATGIAARECSRRHAFALSSLPGCRGCGLTSPNGRGEVASVCTTLCREARLEPKQQ